MVKVLENNGYRFYIYSNDHPPIHVHVLKADSEAKIILEPDILIKSNYGFKLNELRKILALVDENYDLIKMKWYETFNQ
jgi:hypothetical protein